MGVRCDRHIRGRRSRRGDGALAHAPGCHTRHCFQRAHTSNRLVRAARAHGAGVELAVAVALTLERTHTRTGTQPLLRWLASPRLTPAQLPPMDTTSGLPLRVAAVYHHREPSSSTSSMSWERFLHTAQCVITPPITAAHRLLLNIRVHHFNRDIPVCLAATGRLEAELGQHCEGGRVRLHS